MLPKHRQHSQGRPLDLRKVAEQQAHRFDADAHLQVRRHARPDELIAAGVRVQAHPMRRRPYAIHQRTGPARLGRRYRPPVRRLNEPENAALFDVMRHVHDGGAHAHEDQRAHGGRVAQQPPEGCVVAQQQRLGEHRHGRVGHNGGVFAGHQEGGRLADADWYNAHGHRVTVVEAAAIEWKSSVRASVFRSTGTYFRMQLSDCDSTLHQ